MPSLAAAKALNAAFKINNPVGVFVGGTNGLGAALAIKLATYATNPEIHIVGRSQSSANSVLEQLKAVNQDGKYEFHQCDVSLMSSSRQLASKLSSTLPSINYLVLSPGIFTLAGRTETSEGMDNKMALHFYSRFAFLKSLLPNLKRAKESGEDARVMSVLDGKRGDVGGVDWEDMDLKRGFSLGKAAALCLTFTDVVYKKLAGENPTIGFQHAYPGIVKTNIGGSLPWYIKPIISPMFSIVGVSASDAGEWLFSALAKPENAQGVHFFDDHGEEVKGKKQGATAEQEQKIWDHAVKMTGV